MRRYESRPQCGRCKYNTVARTANRLEFCCGNPDSDAYGVPTAYNDSCEEFEEDD